jgi:hypothetical protein
LRPAHKILIVVGLLAVAVLADGRLASKLIGGDPAVRLRAGVSGDPGGRILAQLQPVVAALPADARVIYRHDIEPRWDSCDGMPGTFHWSEVVVQVHFVTGARAGDVLRHADAALTSLGWRRWMAQDDPATPPAWQWTRPLADGMQANVYVGQDRYGRYGQNEWTLFASAAALGPTPVRAGC